jgi:excisionase family DNA binding protein
VAKSTSGEFYSFDEVLRQLSIDENRLKRLVSEGEIRAFREGDQMKFKRSEIDTLAGRSGRSGQTSETSLTEISLEDDSSPTVNVAKGKGDTLKDDLLDEPDLSQRGGMRTAEISSQDTFIDQGGDVGMSTEPIDFTEEQGEAEEVKDIGAEKKKPAGRKAPQRVVIEDEVSSPVWSAILGLTFALGVCGVLVALSASRGYSNGITNWFSKQFGPEKAAAPPQPGG